MKNYEVKFKNCQGVTITELVECAWKAHELVKQLGYEAIIYYNGKPIAKQPKKPL